MFDKLEKHNNRKISYVINRRIEVLKNAVLSFFNVNKGEEKYNFSNYYYFSTKK